MTRFTIDARTVRRIIQEDAAIAGQHQLVGPASLRSEVLALLHADVREGILEERAAREQLEALAGIKIRLLGDRVSRLTAWKLALRLDLDDTALAEYLAVATLQSDALVTEDPRLKAAAEGVIRVADFAELAR